MCICVGCDALLAEEYCGGPRLPCPHCGKVGRRIEEVVTAGRGFGDGFSVAQSRGQEDGKATLNDFDQIEFHGSGAPPRNEEGALDAAETLINKLNSEGAIWGVPVEGEADVDAVSENQADPSRKLLMQVVRASANRDMWQTLHLDGEVNVSLTVEQAASELIAVIEKKSGKYPKEQKEKTILVIDAQRTPTHTFGQVHKAFEGEFLPRCNLAGFQSVWVVGATVDLVTRLDTLK